MNNIVNIEDLRKIRFLANQITYTERQLNIKILNERDYKEMQIHLIRLKAKLKLAKLPKEY